MARRPREERSATLHVTVKELKPPKRLVNVVEFTVVRPLADIPWRDFEDRLFDLSTIAPRLLNDTISDLGCNAFRRRLERLNAPAGEKEEVPLSERSGVAPLTFADRSVAESVGRQVEFYRTKLVETAEAIGRTSSQSEREILERDARKWERRCNAKVPSDVYKEYSALALSLFNRWLKSGGKMSLPSFRVGCPVMVKATGTKFGRDEVGYWMSLHLGGTSNAWWPVVVLPEGGSAHATARKIADGEYRALNCKVLRAKRRRATGEAKPTWVVKLAFERPAPTVAPNPEVAVAVHGGIKCAATLACSNGSAFVADSGAKILHTKAQLAARRARIGGIGKEGTLGDGARGHGTARRFERLQKIEEVQDLSIEGWCRRLAAIVVKKALRWGAGTILLEDYSPKKLADDAEERGETDRSVRLLRNFPTARLRTAIEQRAVKAGLRILLVPAYYECSTCPKCGNFGVEQNRGELFECSACGFRRSSDNVAALNMLHACGFLDSTRKSEQKVEESGAAAFVAVGGAEAERIGVRSRKGREVEDGPR